MRKKSLKNYELRSNRSNPVIRGKQGAESVTANTDYECMCTDCAHSPHQVMSEGETTTTSDQQHIYIHGDTTPYHNQRKAKTK